MSASGRPLPVFITACAGQVECKRLISTAAIDWSVAMQKDGHVHAFTHLANACCDGHWPAHSTHHAL